MTNNEIAERNGGTLEVFPPAQVPSSMARAMLAEHANMYNDAWKLAGALVKTTMVPKRFLNKQGDATAAILYGAEIGLNPIQSLQRVVAIHGMPSLEARTMVGLLKSRGYKVRTIEQSDVSVTVEGVAPDGETSSSTWTIDRAKRAGYVPTPVPGSKERPDVEEDWVTVEKWWDNKKKVSILGNMKYITDPQTMLKAKAQAEVCREMAPDVLMGISYSREELESEDQRQFDRDAERGATPARVSSAPVTVDEIFAEEVPLSSDGIAGDNPLSAEEIVRHRDEQLAKIDEQAKAAPEAPAGDVTEDQGDAAPDPQPSPAEQPETVPDPEPAPAPAKKAPAKKAAAKRDTDKPKSRLRAPLEKRLFTLLGDAGLSGAAERDGRIAVYRAITENPEVASTDDLDDVTVGKVCDQLYVWQQQDELDDRIAGILSDAARDEAEKTSAASAADPTTEGNDQ